MNLAAVDALVEKGIAEGTFPGASYAVWSKGEWAKRHHGRFTYCPDDRKVDGAARWDVASLSKVVATTSLAMRLYERGAYGLDQPVAEALPEFRMPNVTFRNLLVHDSGLIPDLPGRMIQTDAETVMRETLAGPATQPPGDKMVYSDLGMITLATALARLAGKEFSMAITDEVLRPLGMRDTGYSPWAKGERERCVPTSKVEPWRAAMRKKRLGEFGAARAFGDAVYIQGEVHDPTAFVLGGVAGHAGIFATLDDLCRFVQSLMEGRVASSETVASFTRRNSERSSRALGWDTKSASGSSAGPLFGPRSFGHTGYTGTSIWGDPDARLAAILLTNRVHPTDEASLTKFRPTFHDEVVRATVG